MLDFMAGADVAADEREATVEVFMRQVRERIELLTAFETFLSVAGSAPATAGADPLVGIESLVDRSAKLEPSALKNVSQHSWLATRRRRFAR